VSFAAACGWSLARSLCVATVGVLIAARVSRLLRSGNGWTSRVLWGMILLPVFVPGLLIGYGYRNFSLSLVHQPFWNELAYAGLTLLMVMPVGTLILQASPPPPVSPAALHAVRLMQARGRRTTWRSQRRLVAIWVRSRLFATVPAWSAMFLLSFQETEVATLMQAAGWPEWTFTRLATGTQLATAARWLLVPVIVQLAVIGVAAALLAGSRRRVASAGPPSEVSASERTFAWGYGLVGLGLLLVVPGTYVLRGTWDGFSVLGAHPRLMEQIGIGLLFGATAGLLAWLVSGAMVDCLRRGTPWEVFIPLLLPGLLGAWTLGLVLAVLFQQPLLRGVYDTPVPMLLGEFLFQLPRAVLVRLLLGQWRDSTAAHQARLLGRAGDPTQRRRSSALLWRLDGRARLTGGLILCYWAYMELSIPSPALLGPPGMTTAPVLLYNQMHYGQIPGLSALVLLTLAVPVVCLCAMSLGARWVPVLRHSLSRR
jgi:ABC-type Fe3+ transport system permease subunit